MFLDNTTERKCDNLLSFGRWSSDYDPADQHLLWQPFDSMIQVYDKALISTCLSNRTLYFIGDSTVRQVFWAVAEKYDKSRAEQESAEAGKHEDIFYHNENLQLSFIWDPYLNTSQTTEIIRNPMVMHPRDVTDSSPKSHVAGIILSTGLWHARYSGDEFAKEHRQALDVAAHYTPKKSLKEHKIADAYLALTPAIILPPPVLNHHWLNPERALTLSRERLANITENLLEYQAERGLEVAWSARAMTMNNSAAIRSGGLHVTREIAAYQAEVLLNRVCNNILFSGSKKQTSLPCVRQMPWKFTAKACFEMFSLTLLVLILCRNYEREPRLFMHRSQAVVVMVATFYYCWLADRTTLFEKGNKVHDVRLFCFCTAAALTISLTRLKSGARSLDQILPHSKAQDVHSPRRPAFLPREVTEEWKGWMQIVILLYHYFGMSQVLPIYQAVRVLVASYLFMTGYGHAAYFLSTEDFSLKRVTKVVLRLNILTCLLSAVMDNNHEFYYFPSLATIWFLITYAVFWRPHGYQASARELFARLLAMLSFCFIVMGNETLLKLVFSLIRKVHGPSINAREFVFRFQLDLLAPFAGMCTAILEGRSSSCGSMPVYARLKARIGGRAIKLIRMVISLLGVMTYAYIAGTFEDKVHYNRWHWILSILPIAAYLSIRKVLWSSCNRFAPIFVWVGSISLELFVLQYHIWLAADTKGLLQLGILDLPQVLLSTTTKGSWTYWIEKVMITTAFLWTSHCCSRATNTLVEWFVQVDESGHAVGRKTLLIRLGLASFLLWGLKFLSNAESRR